jgi:hypothetical protein
MDVTTFVDRLNNNACGTATAFSPFVLAETSYAFGGFFQPVENAPTLNALKAGAAVPAEFNLGGSYGLAVLASGSPASQSAACGTFASSDAIEETVMAAGSSLSYDSAIDRYSYVWKSEAGWANTCRVLTLRFFDGTVRSANFQFKK